MKTSLMLFFAGLSIGSSAWAIDPGNVFCHEVPASTPDLPPIAFKSNYRACPGADQNAVMCQEQAECAVVLPETRATLDPMTEDQKRAYFVTNSSYYTFAPSTLMCQGRVDHGTVVCPTQEHCKMDVYAQIVTTPVQIETAQLQQLHDDVSKLPVGGTNDIRVFPVGALKPAVTVPAK